MRSVLVGFAMIVFKEVVFRLIGMVVVFVVSNYNFDCCCEFCLVLLFVFLVLLS